MTWGSAPALTIQTTAGTTIHPSPRCRFHGTTVPQLTSLFRKKSFANRQTRVFWFIPEIQFKMYGVQVHVRYWGEEPPLRVSFPYTPQKLTWSLKTEFWKRRFRAWKSSFSGSMSIFGGVHQLHIITFDSVLGCLGTYCWWFRHPHNHLGCKKPCK